MVFHLFSQHCFPPSSNISSIYTIFHEFPPCFPGSHAILPRSCSSPPSPAPRVPGAGAARWSNAKVWTTSRLTGWWSNWDRGIWWFGRAGFPAGRWLGRDSRIFQLSSSYIVYIDIYIDVYFVFIIVLGMAGFPACSMYPVVTCRRWQYDNWLFSRSGSPEIKCKRRNKFCS